MTVQITKTALYQGDALAPSDTDILVQEGRLDVGLPVPDGWNVLTGNSTSSFVIRIGYRYEIETGRIS